MEIPTQPTLWRLYTDTRFRKEFLFDKHHFYQKYEIPEDIVHFLEDTPVYELTLFADTLLQKRMNKVKAFLPLTFKLIGKDTQMLFFKFCDYYTPTGVQRHQDDAFQFIHYLLKHRKLSFHLKLNLYVKSVLLYEQYSINSEEEIPNAPRLKFYSHDYVPHTTLKSRKRRRPPVQKFLGIEEWIRRARLRSHHIRLNPSKK